MSGGPGEIWKICVFSSNLCYEPKTALKKKEVIKKKSERSHEIGESFPRQVDKKSRGPQGERGLEYSRRKEGQTCYFFSSTFLRII